MKPNILGLGFYSHDIPQSCLSDLRVQLGKRSKFVRVMIRDTTRKRAIINNNNNIFINIFSE